MKIKKEGLVFIEKSKLEGLRSKLKRIIKKNKDMVSIINERGEVILSYHSANKKLSEHNDMLVSLNNKAIDDLHKERESAKYLICGLTYKNEVLLKNIDKANHELSKLRKEHNGLKSITEQLRRESGDERMQFMNRISDIESDNNDLIDRNKSLAHENNMHLDRIIELEDVIDRLRLDITNEGNINSLLSDRIFRYKSATELVLKFFNTLSESKGDNLVVRLAHKILFGNTGQRVIDGVTEKLKEAYYGDDNK